jgi:hypothetical protein
MTQVQEETRVRSESNAATAAGEQIGWWAQLQQRWQKFLTALLQALSAWVV